MHSILSYSICNDIYNKIISSGIIDKSNRVNIKNSGNSFRLLLPEQVEDLWESDLPKCSLIDFILCHLS